MKGAADLYWYSAASCRHPLFGRSTTAGAYTDEFIHFNGTGGPPFADLEERRGAPSFPARCALFAAAMERVG
jgi:hypothetical protein